MAMKESDVRQCGRIEGELLLASLFDKKSKSVVSQNILIELEKSYKERFETNSKYILFLKSCCDLGRLDILYVVSELIDKDDTRLQSYMNTSSSNENNECKRIIDFSKDPLINKLQLLSLGKTTVRNTIYFKETLNAYLAGLKGEIVSHYENMVLSFLLFLVLESKKNILSLDDCIVLFDHFCNSKNCNKRRKDSCILLIINYCLEYKHDFFRLPKKFYNHCIYALNRIASNELLTAIEKKEYIDKYIKQIRKMNDFSTGKKIRVAICIAGVYRNHREALESIASNLVEPLNADVFIHTWDNETIWAGFGGSPRATRVFGKKGGMLGEKYRWLANLAPIMPNTYEVLSQPITRKLSKKLFENILHPKGFIIEREDEFTASIEKPDNYGKLRGSLNQLKMFYGIKKSFDLALSEEKYDYIIRVRPDLLISESIDISKFESFENNTLYCNVGNVGLGDAFFIMSGAMAYNFSSFVDLMFDKEELSPFNNYPLYDSHNLLFSWLVANNYCFEKYAMPTPIQHNLPVPIKGLIEAITIDERNQTLDYSGEIKEFIDYLKSSFCR